MSPDTPNKNIPLKPAEPPTSLSRPVFLSRVEAGFPSPAEDYVEGQLDLNEHLIKKPAATFFLRVSGNSMIGAGIHPGDLLVIDRSIHPTSGKVVIAVVDGELTVKRLSIQGETIELLPENPDFSPIRIQDADNLSIWGVVTHVIHAL